MEKKIVRNKRWQAGQRSGLTSSEIRDAVTQGI